MYNDFLKNFTDMTEQSRKVMEPVQQYNKLFVNRVEQMTAMQMSATRFYADLYVEQLKALSEIKDFSALTSFNSKQVELVNTLTEKMTEDNSRLQEEAKTFQNDVQELITENVKKAAKVA